MRADLDRSKGAGYGGPARGYSWPPFEVGNEAAVRHGATSERHIRPIAARHKRRVLRQMRTRVSDLDPIGRALLEHYGWKWLPHGSCARHDGLGGMRCRPMCSIRKRSASNASGCVRARGFKDAGPDCTILTSKPRQRPLPSLTSTVHPSSRWLSRFSSRL